MRGARIAGAERAQLLRLQRLELGHARVFVGAATACSPGALAAGGAAPLDVRLLKLAIEKTSHAVAGVEGARQGAGLVDVDHAYDVYLGLAAEMQKARADATHRTPFPYELRAVTALEGRSEQGEGIWLHEAPAAGADIAVALTDETRALVDAGSFVAPLAIVHDANFFTAPSELVLQSSGTAFTLAFDATKLAAPGTYLDTVRVVRADGLVLLRIPVVVQIASRATPAGAIATFDGAMEPTTPCGVSRSRSTSRARCASTRPIVTSEQRRARAIARVHDPGEERARRALRRR